MFFLNPKIKLETISHSQVCSTTDTHLSEYNAGTTVSLISVYLWQFLARQSKWVTTERKVDGALAIRVVS